MPELECRSQQIQQELMNLMTNAREALNKKYEGYDDNKKLDENRMVKILVIDDEKAIRKTLKESQ